MIRKAKLRARQDTIIQEYQRIFGRSTLPTDQQYWTMCSRCSPDSQFGDEYNQVINSGLIVPKQWYGVDIDPEKIRLNAIDYPESHWINMDFYRAMASAPTFRPGIVNIDTMSMPENAAPYVAEILDMLSKVPGQMMVVINVVTQFSHIKRRKTSIEKFLTLLVQEPLYQESYDRCGWQHDKKKYTYADVSEMTTLTFYRRK